MIYDFIVVGHGLAGSALAYTLSRQGKTVLVFDEHKENAASRVAAGLVNPVAGKRFAKTWLADTFVPFAHDFYTQLEQESGLKLFYHLPILKLFSSIEEQNNWMGKSAEGNWSAYIEATLPQLPASDFIHQEYGGIRIRQGGYLDIKSMLHYLEERLRERNAFRNEKLEPEELVLTETGVAYREVQARALVFCDGFRSAMHPYFGWLPFSLNKGEVLDVETPDFSPECIYNKAVYVVPLGGNRFRAGATYNWRNVDEEVSPEGVEELKNKLAQVLKQPFTVVAQRAGIRPAVRDRRPLAGQHPEHRQLYIFNGMGSKGVLMAPFLAQAMAGELEGRNELPPESNITRYYSFYKKVSGT